MENRKTDNFTAVRRFYRRSGLKHFVRGRRHALLYNAGRAALRPVRATNLPLAFAFGDRVADVVFRGLPGIRRMVLAHLAIALGETHSPAAREQIARRAYRHMARNYVEMAKLDYIRGDFDAYVSLEGWEHVEAVRVLGRGAIIVTGHFGNCELLAAYMVHRGLGITVVAKQLRDPRINRALTDFRRDYGVEVILRDGRPEAGREVLRVLKQRRMLAVQLDMDVHVPSVSIPFFGRPART